MTEKEIIVNTAEFVQSELKDAEGGHDWWHIERVWKNARTIAATENVNHFIVELGALLHDIADSKFHDGDETIGATKARTFNYGGYKGREMYNPSIKPAIGMTRDLMKFSSSVTSTTFVLPSPGA